jgi:surfactin synthase thioesterase subunit
MDFATVAVTGLVTLIGSGFGTAIVNYWLTERKARRELRRTKLEELFLMVTDWVKAININSLTIHSAMIGDLDYNQANDLIIDHLKDSKNSKNSFANVEMLIALYFPELKADYQALHESRAQINKTTQMHKRAYKEGNNDPSFAAVLLDELKKLDGREKALKGHIARLISRVTK